MAWAFWLAVPVVATLLAALLTWLPGRRSAAAAARRPDTVEAMRVHRDYLDALAVPALGTYRVAPSDAALRVTEPGAWD